MSDPASSSPRSSLDPDAAEQRRWEPPTPAELASQIPGCAIVRLLGRGAMGAVYEGRQTRLDRRVAVKIINSTLDDADVNFAERFKNEARAMARLSHPGIVAVYDSGQTESGLLYIIMELVEGSDVARMIAQQQRLHTAHAMAIIAHVCDALAYAHAQGIIHRDIKPANIMVGYDGVVKVADFGLAKINTGGETMGLTKGGVAMGTPHYMAPEALTLGQEVDQRADLYALGVMFYHMLTGKLPQGLFEMPSLKVPGLDPRYDDIIARALREDRAVRYQTARDLRRDLDTILTQPVVKVEPGAEIAPAALPTQARPVRPEQPAENTAPADDAFEAEIAPAKSSSLPSLIVCVAVIVLLSSAYWWAHQKQTETITAPGRPPPDEVSVTPSIAMQDVAQTKPATPLLTTNGTPPRIESATIPASHSQPVPPVPPAADTSAAEAFEHDWTNSSGTTIRAAFGGVDGNQVTLLTPGGATPYALDKLDRTSASLAETMARSRHAWLAAAGGAAWATHVMAWHNLFDSVSIDESPAAFSSVEDGWLFDGVSSRTSCRLTPASISDIDSGYDVEVRLEVSARKGRPWIDLVLPMPGRSVCQIGLRPPESVSNSSAYIILPPDRERQRYTLRYVLEPAAAEKRATLHIAWIDSTGRTSHYTREAMDTTGSASSKHRDIEFAVYNGNVAFHRMALLDFKGTVTASRTNWTASREINKASLQELENGRQSLKVFAGTSARPGTVPDGLIARYVFDSATTEPGAELFNVSQHDGVLDVRGRYRENVAHLNTPELDVGSFTLLVALKPSASVNCLLCNGTNLSKGMRLWMSLARASGGGVRVAFNAPRMEKVFDHVTIARDAWTRLVITYNAVSGRLTVRNHLDQRAELTIPSDPAAESPRSVWAFANYASGTTFNGLVDDFLLFNRVLSEAELDSLNYRTVRSD